MAEKLSKYNKAGDEITKYGFISNMEAFIGKLISGQITAQTNDYLQSHGIDREVALTNLLARPVKDDPTSAVLSRKESIKTDKETNKDKFHVKYTLIDKKDVEKKLRNIYIKLFEYHIADNPILNEEWAGYVNDGKDKPRFLFKEDNEPDVRAQAMKIWIDNKLEDSLYWHEEMWTDHEFDPEWGDVQFNGWNFYTTENSDDIEFKSPDGEEGWFLKSEVNDTKDKPRSVFTDEDKMKEELLAGEDRDTYLTRGGIKMDECDCGACDGGGESGDFSAGANTADASGQYTTPLFGVMRRKIGRVSDKKDGTEDVRMPDMLKECVKTVYLTESQINIIKKGLLKEDGVETGFYGGFEFGYTAPAFSDKETRDHKNMFAKSWKGRIGKKRKKKSKKH